MATVIQRQTTESIPWSSAVYPPWQIVTKYSLPVLIKVSTTTDKRILHRVPGLDGLVCKLQKMVRVDQVTAGVTTPSWVKDEGARSAGRQGQNILTIPQEYTGLFQVVTDAENPECLKGIEELISKRPRVVKVIESATNVPKSALISLKVGDLLQVGETCQRATHDGIKKFIRCTLNNRVIVLNPAWNGVYEVVHDDIKYYMSDLLKRFPLPLTVKLVHLEKHSKALLEKLPNGGKTCHLVLSSKTNAEFILGVDLNHEMALVIAEDIDVNVHIPEWVSPSNAMVRRERMMPNETFGDDIRLDQVICRCKEQLVLLRPWKELFVGPAPKLQPRNFRIGSAASDSSEEPFQGPFGDYSNSRGILRGRELVDDIHYISGPVMPGQQQGLLERELLDEISYISRPVITTAREESLPVDDKNYIILEEISTINSESDDTDDDEGYQPMPIPDNEGHEPPLPPPRNEGHGPPLPPPHNEGFEPPLPPPRIESLKYVSTEDDSDESDDEGYLKPITPDYRKHVEPIPFVRTQLKPHEVMIKEELENEQELLGNVATEILPTAHSYEDIDVTPAYDVKLSCNNDPECIAEPLNHGVDDGACVRTTPTNDPIISDPNLTAQFSNYGTITSTSPTNYENVDLSTMQQLKLSVLKELLETTSSPQNYENTSVRQRSLGRKPKQSRAKNEQQTVIKGSNLQKPRPCPRRESLTRHSKPVVVTPKVKQSSSTGSLDTPPVIQQRSSSKSLDMPPVIQQRSSSKSLDIPVITQRSSTGSLDTPIIRQRSSSVIQDTSEIEQISSSNRENYENTLPRVSRARRHHPDPPVQDSPHQGINIDSSAAQETTNTDGGTTDYDGEYDDLRTSDNAENKATGDTQVGLAHHADKNPSSNPQDPPKRDRLDELSVEEVIKTLQSLRIPETVQDIFQQEEVDGVLLSHLTESILKEEFGMTAFHALKLVRFINGWKPT